MKPSRLVLAISTLALAFLFSFAVSAAAASSKPPKTPSPTAAPVVDKRKVVKAVDAAAGTVEIEYMRDQSTHAYKLDALSVIMVNNSLGTIDQIKVGMVVTDFIERDSQTLDRIALEQFGSSPTTKTPKKKKKSSG